MSTDTTETADERKYPMSPTVPCHPDRPCVTLCGPCRRNPGARISAHAWQEAADRYAREGLQDSAGEYQWRATTALQQWREP